MRPIEMKISIKFKFLILILCTIASIGYSQQTNTSMAPSSWIGKVKMGDANPEVVFNIFKDSLGQLTGNLGVPSKGIQGIPLSTVHIKQDSIILESTTSQLIYKGIFEKDGQRINGRWIEPQLTSPLILIPLTKTIDYDNFEKKNTSSLPLEFESKHFSFYSKKGDTSVLKNVSKSLESNYSRITEGMQTHFESKIDVFIYPNTTSFHTAINAPNAPDWVVGAASKNELKMVSPLNPGSEHSYESLMKAIVHEFTHTVVLNLRKQELSGLPNWLHEGYAYYEAKQLTKSQREIIHTNVLNNTIPTWNELEKANSYQFGDMNGYPMSATIIEFLVASYGLDKLRQYITASENIYEIYNISKEDLEVLWLKHIKKG
jgi:hypothetical protein